MINIIGFTMGIILALIVGIGFGYFVFTFFFMKAMQYNHGRLSIFKQLHEDFPNEFHSACECRTILPRLPDDLPE